MGQTVGEMAPSSLEATNVLSAELSTVTFPPRPPSFSPTSAVIPASPNGWTLSG